MPDALLDAITAPEASEDDLRVARAAQDVVTQLQSDFKPRNDLYKRIEDVLHGKIPLRIPSAFKGIAVPARSPLPQQHRHTIVAALSDDPPKVNCPPLGFGESWQVNASLREHFFDASWRRQEKEAGRPLQREFMDSLVTKGEGVLKTVERSKRAWSGYGSLSSKVLADLMDQGWQAKSTDDRRKEYDRRTEEYKQQAPYPIASTVVLPETYLYLKGEDGYTLHAEVKDVPYLDTLARFVDDKGEPKWGVGREGKIVPAAYGLPVAEWTKSMDGKTALRMIELWTWRECVYILCGPGQDIGTGTIVKRIKHGYGNPITKTLRGPYFHAHALVTHERLPQYAGMGLLTPFLDLYVLYDEVRTMRAVNGHRTAYAAFTDESENQGGLPGEHSFGLDGTEQAGERQPLTITPGAVLPGKLRPLEQPRAGVDFNVFEQTLRADLDMVVPSVLNGLVPPGEDPSGWQFAQRVHNARLYFSPMVGNAQRAHSERVAFESWLIENRIGERVYARGEVVKGDKSRSGQLSVGPEDLKGLHDVYDVLLEPKLPSTEVVEVRLHGEKVDRGFESQADAITAMGGNPEEVRIQRLLEQYQDSDLTKQRIFRRVDQLLGQQELQALQDASQSAAQVNGAQPQPGAALAGMGNPIVPGQNAPVSPTPPGMAPAGEPAGGTPGAPSGVPAEHLVMAQ